MIHIRFKFNYPALVLTLLLSSGPCAGLFVAAQPPLINQPPQTNQPPPPRLPPSQSPPVSLAPPNGAVDITMLKAGRAYFEQRRFADALAAFGKFRDQRPNNLAVHFWLATALTALNRDKEAVEEYKSCLNLAASIGMDSCEMRSNFGNLLLRCGFTKEPLFDFKRAVTIDSRCPAPYLALAACLIDSGNFDEALTALDSYKKSGGLDINALYLHGLALAAKEQYDQARKDLTAYLVAATDQSNALRNGAAAHALDQGLTSAHFKYVTTGNTNPRAVDLASRILNQLPASPSTNPPASQNN